MNISIYIYIYIYEPDEVGKRKAFLVGINYIGTGNQLSGCINDVRDQMAALNLYTV